MKKRAHFSDDARSLYILLTAEGPRKMLSSVRTLMVDEIHAVADESEGRISLSRWPD